MLIVSDGVGMVRAAYVAVIVFVGSDRGACAPALLMFFGWR